MFYWGSVELKPDDILVAALDFDGSHLTNLFGRTFGSKYLDNIQKSLALLCYQLALLVQKRLSRHGVDVSPHTRGAGVSVKLSRLPLCIVQDWVHWYLISNNWCQNRKEYSYQQSLSSIWYRFPPVIKEREREVSFLCVAARVKEGLWWAMSSLDVIL